MDMLTPDLNLDSKTPLYQQLYTYIKEEIQSGRLVKNTRLPSKRKLSQYLNISQNTIQTAYEQLIEEGYAASLERKGFFVCDIDHIKHLQLQPEFVELKSRQQLLSIKYDFSYHGVDMSTFPFAVWRKFMKEIINEYDPELLTLGDSLGFYPLRTAIAGYLHQSRGVNCTEDQVIISSGTEILFQTLIQLFDDDSIYGIENPGYDKLSQLFTSNRARFKAIPIDKNGMLPNEIKKSNVNIICITPAHQFPSGEIMPINRRIQLLNWANEENNRYLIEDDYDSEFKYSGKPIPALQGLSSTGKVIYMGSLSKSLSPALRVSYMVLPSNLMKKYRERLSYLICPVPILEQKVLCRFITDGYFERHLNKMRNIYKKKRETLVRAIQNLNCGIEVLGADAGQHLLLRIPNHMTEDELISSALKKGVKVYGISKYYYDTSYLTLPPSIIIGYAVLTEAEINKAVQLLYEAWMKKE